jgi:myo-inositol-1(or 4)-monophosphatase
MGSGVTAAAAALNLAHQADGRLGGGVALDTKLWDIAAGALIARESGVFLGCEGRDFSIRLTMGAAPPLWPELSNRTRTALTR